MSVTGIVIILSIIGISKLEVENSFINYFNKNTEIYKGMKLIDEKLGGTTPLEVILKFPEKAKEKKSKPYQYQGNSFQSRKTIKSGRSLL